jgi:hypothetical protein
LDVVEGIQKGSVWLFVLIFGTLKQESELQLVTTVMTSNLPWEHCSHKSGGPVMALGLSEV